ncbi:hypothetical protein G5714_024730 [Onychostoma macrolepis]|uniref:Uncharacterized protein n=1 Tax=Onychostoma macrolepis TaxID=369639 RepID=A0A7J6BHI4_9TELE|nr:hypothetical protein G5714_024730 [Onychostoma macrolepis]
MKVKAGSRSGGIPARRAHHRPSRPHRRAGGARRVRWYPKMVNYAWAGQRKLWWRPMASLACKSVVRPGQQDGGHGSRNPLRVCNNSPAESTSPENGWRWASGPYPAVGGKKKYGHRDRLGSGRAARWPRSLGAGRVEPRGADLGGSSKYSSESFEGRSGEGFHVNSS